MAAECKMVKKSFTGIKYRQNSHRRIIKLRAFLTIKIISSRLIGRGERLAQTRTIDYRFIKSKNGRIDAIADAVTRFFQAPKFNNLQLYSFILL